IGISHCQFYSRIKILNVAALHRDFDVTHLPCWNVNLRFQLVCVHLAQQDAWPTQGRVEVPERLSPDGITICHTDVDLNAPVALHNLFALNDTPYKYRQHKRGELVPEVFEDKLYR